MSGNGNDFLDDLTEQQEEVEIPETPEAANPDAKVETVEQQPENPAPEVTTTPEAKEEQSVPYAALKAERDKRQAYERELNELRVKAQQDQSKPDFYEQPDAYVQQVVAQTEQRLRGQMYAALEAQARASYSDYDEVFEEVKAAAEGNPAITQQIFAAPNPAMAVYEVGKQLREMKRMQDPATYRAEIEAEIRAKVEAEYRVKEGARAKANAAIPPDLTQTRNAAGQYAPQDGDVFSDLFK